MFGDFKIARHWFAIMDAGMEQDFKFNESISFIVQCANQQEIDFLWKKLSAVPESEQCGWCKDKYGISRSEERRVGKERRSTPRTGAMRKKGAKKSKR